MSKGRLSEAAWANARTLWEADPKLTFSDIADMIFVSKQAVAQKVKKDGWAKLSSQSDLARRAYSLADRVAVDDQKLAAQAEAEKVAKEAGLPVSAPVEVPSVSSVIEENAVNLKAKVLDRHRKEVDGLRTQLYRALQTSDYEKARLAKTSAEAMKIVQELERKSWGFEKDDSTDNPGTVTVVIERKEV
jgi:predicted DNA-binding protein YlxM (UPF0122 family)